MDQDLQTIETILRYLEDKMDAAEREAFEAQLDSDEALKKEVEYYQKAKSGFDGLKAAEFQVNLDSWEKEAKEEAKSGTDNIRDINSGTQRKTGLFSILAMAASIGAAFLLFWFLMKPAGVLTSQEILASYTPEYNMPAVRDASGSEHRLKEGIQAYMEQRYVDAATYFEAIPVTDEQYIDAQMFLGYTGFESQRYNKAITAFSNVKNANSPRFSDKADWFTALSHLAAGNEAVWKSNLERIAADAKHQYNEEAVEVRGKLD